MQSANGLPVMAIIMNESNGRSICAEDEMYNMPFYKVK